MIPLNVQIKSIFFSFFYGCFFSFLLNLNYKFVYLTKGIRKVIFNLIFIIDNVLLYFIIIRHINNGILHYYFVLSIIIGFFSVNKLTSKVLIPKNR